MEVRHCGNRTRPRVRRRLRVTKPGGQDEGRGALGGKEADALGEGRGSEQGTAGQQPRPPSSVMNSRRLIIRSPRRRGRAASAALRGGAPWRSSD